MPDPISGYEDLASTPGAAGDVIREKLDYPALTTETPSDTAARQMRDVQQKAKIQRVRAGDLAARDIPSFTDDSGAVQPVTDEAGQPLTQFDKKSKVGWDSAGNPRKVSYDSPTGPPKLVDPLSTLGTDAKTGDIYRSGPGLPTTWVGQDEKVAAQLKAKETDKALGDLQTRLGRKLTLDEHEVTKGGVELKHGGEALLGAGVTGLDKAEDLPTAQGLINAHFDQRAQEAQPGTFTSFFGAKPDTAALSQIEDERKRTLQKAADVYGLKDRLTATKARIDTQRAAAQSIADARLQSALDQYGGKVSGVAATGESAAAPVDIQKQKARQDAVTAAQQGQKLYGLTADGQIDFASQGRPFDAATQAAADGIIPALPPDQEHHLWTAQQFTEAKAGHKTYGADPDGNLTINPRDPIGSIDEATADGIIEPDRAAELRKQLEPIAKRAAELQKLEQDNPNLSKALAVTHGATDALGFWGGGAAASAAATPLNVAIGGAFPPAAWATIPIAESVEFLAGGGTALWLKHKAESALANYSESVKTLLDSTELHPLFDAAGNLGGIIVGAGVTSIPKLARAGLIAAEGAGATATTGAKIAAAATSLGPRVAAGAAGGAVFEGALRPAFDYAVQTAQDVAGIQHDKLQPPTAGSILENAAIGALFAGHGITFKEYDSGAMADIAKRAANGAANGLPMEKVLSQSEIEAFNHLTEKLGAMSPEQAQAIVNSPNFRAQIKQAILAPDRPIGDEAMRKYLDRQESKWTPEQRAVVESVRRYQAQNPEAPLTEASQAAFEQTAVDLGKTPDEISATYSDATKQPRISITAGEPIGNAPLGGPGAPAAPTPSAPPPVEKPVKGRVIDPNAPSDATSPTPEAPATTRPSGKGSKSPKAPAPAAEASVPEENSPASASEQPTPSQPLASTFPAGTVIAHGDDEIHIGHEGKALTWQGVRGGQIVATGHATSTRAATQAGKAALDAIPKAPPAEAPTEAPAEPISNAGQPSSVSGGNAPAGPAPTSEQPDKNAMLEEIRAAKAEVDAAEKGSPEADAALKRHAAAVAKFKDAFDIQPVSVDGLLEPKARRKLEENIADKIQGADPMARVHLEKRLNQLKRDHQQVRREIDKATKNRDRLQLQHELLDIEERMRGMLGDEQTPAPTPTKAPASPSKPASTPSEPKFTGHEAKAIVEKLIAESKHPIAIGQTKNESGFQFDTGSGQILVEPAKAAQSIKTALANQKTLGLPETTHEEAMQTFIRHEVWHAADNAVAQSKGKTLEQFYNEVPDSEFPKDWNDWGMKWRSDWEKMPKWKRRAEFVAGVAQGEYDGKIPESIWKRVKEVLEYLRGLAKNGSEWLKAHVAEMEKRVNGRMEAEKPKPASKSPKAEKPAPKTEAPTKTKAQELDDEMRDAFATLDAAAPKATDEARGIPADKMGVFLGIAQKLVADGVKTPEELATRMQRNAGDKALRYSQAMWDLLGVVDPALRGSHDWASVYQGLQPSGEGAPAETAKPHEALADWVKERLADAKPFTLQDLYYEADNFFGGRQSENAYTFKDATDAMELGVTRYIAARAKTFTPTISDTRAAQQTIRDLETLILKQLPTQGRQQNEEMTRFQQFSTPPTLAFAANWAANIHAGETAMEPSAGLGSLAIFGKIAGAKVIVNELAPRRAEMLKTLGFDQVLTEDAEQLNNVLPAELHPSVVVMNPPFSQTAGRMGDKRDLMTGARHIDQMLKRLEDDGRLVAIVGRGMTLDAPTFRDWWAEKRKDFTVRAVIGVNGKEYAKYGTTFDNLLLVIDKSGPTTAEPVTGNVDKVEELIPLLKGVRDVRTEPNREAAGKPLAEVEAGASADGKPALGSADAVGAGERPLGRPDGEAPGSGGLGDGTREPATAGSGRGGKPVRKPVGAGGVPDAGGSSGDAAGGDALGNRNGEPDAVDTGSGRGVEVEKASKDHSAADEEAQVFDRYQPSIKVKGAQPNATPLAESSAMASVDSPAATYSPKIDEKIIASGALTDAQLETLVLVGAAHEKMLPSGERQGFFNGDGTGVGKTRQIVGVFLDNWNRGRKKHVWLTEGSKLLGGAKKGMTELGWNPALLIPHGKTKAGDAITAKEGILFTTYTTLASESGDQKTGLKKRLDQIVNWLGKDFDGVIAMDEAHKMGNVLPVKGQRGMTKPAAAALAGLALQKALPKARVLYMSATGATDVRNLAYAERLGLWGAGTPFNGAREFVTSIEAAGVAAMEMVARDMKAMGLYLSRNIAYNGVQYDKLIHKLTPEQVGVYDELAGAWQTVLQNMGAALKETNQGKNGMAKSAANSKFWGAHQRFFNQVMTSMQLPSVIAKMEESIAAGRAVVIQLVNTNEAATKDILAQKRTEAAAADEDVNYEAMDFTPRKALMDYIERGFPTQQYETYVDENGKEQTRPAIDSKGNPIQNAEAVKMRDALLERLAKAKVPDSPLDAIINHFGTDKVAEVTGRSVRVVRNKDGAMTPERWSIVKGLADANAFQDDKKQILIFSAAGGTGMDYHADLARKNQRPRDHITLQAGWRADTAVQGFGRTHRNNQKQPPHYFLASTNLNAQKRFVSTIARRLDQLGALTKGQRDTGSQGMMSAADNLENEYATEALKAMYRELMLAQEINGISLADFEEQTGQKLADKDGNLSPDAVNIKRFLNRLLNFKVETMNKVWDAFYDRFMHNIEAAQQRGELDTGMETIKAKSARVVREERLNEDKRTGATTDYKEVELTQPTKIVSFDEIEQRAKLGFVQNIQSGMVWGHTANGQRTSTKTGAVTDNAWLLNHKGRLNDVPLSAIQDPEKWKTLTPEEARPLIAKAVTETPKTHTETAHMITGALLPIWNRLHGSNRVFRITLDNGERLLGRRETDQSIADLLRDFQLGAANSSITPERIVEAVKNGQRVRFADGTALKTRRVYQDERIEITGPKATTRLPGIFGERIQYEYRYFIEPAKAGAAVEQIMLNNPPVEGLSSALDAPAPRAVAFRENFDEEDPETWGRFATPEVKALWPLYDETQGEPIPKERSALEWPESKETTAAQHLEQRMSSPDQRKSATAELQWEQMRAKVNAQIAHAKTVVEAARDAAEERAGNILSHEVDRELDAKHQTLDAAAPKVEYDALPGETKDDIENWIAEHVNLPAGREWSASDIGDNLRGLVDQVALHVVEKPLGQITGYDRRPSDLAVGKYAAKYRAGERPPPILVDGNKFLDGGHRFKAALQAGEKTIPTVDIGPLLRMDWRAWMANEQSDTFPLSASSTLDAAPVRAFVEEDMKPVLEATKLSLGEISTVIQKVLSPISLVEPDAADSLMTMKGVRDERAFIVDSTFKAAEKMFAKMPRPENVQFIDRVKLGEDQPNEAHKFVDDTFRKIDDATLKVFGDEWVAAGGKPEEVPIKYKENHYRVGWKVIPGSGGEERNVGGIGRRPIAGSKGMAKHSTLADMSEGVERGGVPMSWNPVTMFKWAQGDLWKWITALRMFKYGKDNSYFVFAKGTFPKLPEGYEWVNDGMFRRYFPAASGEGLVTPGRYAVEKNYARVLNNFLSRDLVRESATGRSMMWIKNFTTGMELVGPFHLFFTGFEVMGSSIGLGLMKIYNRGMLHGDTAMLFDGIKDAIGSPASVVTTFKTGKRMERLLTEEGFAASPEGKALLKQFPDAAHLMHMAFIGGAKFDEPEWANRTLKTFVENLNNKNFIGATLRAVPALVEFLMKPLFEKYIPRIKLGMFAREFSYALRENASKLSANQVSEETLARQVWAFIEGRFGEKNFDNLFWNRTFQAGAQLFTRSVTYKLGTVETVLGAFAGQARKLHEDIKAGRMPELHRNAAWLLGLCVITAALGSILQTALSGKKPESLTDLVYPRIDPKDDKIRVGLPTYIKDPIHFMHSPSGYVTSSLASWVGRVVDLWRNQDFYGTKIRNEDDKLMQQALDVAKYGGATLLPFSIRGYQNLSEQDVGALRKMLALASFNPAPKYITNSPAENQAKEYRHDSMPIGGRTKEQSDKSRSLSFATAQMRRGEPISAPAGRPLTLQDMKTVTQRAALTPLQSDVKALPLDRAERVYAKASPAEKAQLAAIMAQKRANEAKKSGAGMFTHF